jgi:hypothetical protein
MSEKQGRQGRVIVSQGATLNIGNFNSARIEVGVESDVMDGETTKEALDRVFDFVEEYVDEKVQQMKKEITED